MFDRAASLERSLAEPSPFDSEPYPPFEPPDANLVDEAEMWDTPDPALLDHDLPIDDPEWEPHPDDLVVVARQAGLGPHTLALLTARPITELSPSARSLALARLTELQSYVEALRLRLVAAIAGPEPATLAERQDDFSPHEVAVASKTSVYAADTTIALARDLSGRLRATARAMSEGSVTAAQARVLSEGTAHLDPELTAEIEGNLLKYSHRQSLAAFRASLRRWLAKKDPAWTTKAERERREVVVHHQPRDDGTGELFLRAPLEITSVIDQALQVCAARSKPELGGTTDQRKLAALRDWADGLLTGQEAPTQHGLPVRVDIVVAASTMLGHDDQPAEIPGVGAIPASAAFWAIADGAEIRCLLVEKTSGRLKAIDPTVYQVPPALAELLIKRHLTSSAPHSNIPAAGCDMEHNIPHNKGGPTDPINVTPVDRRWHRPKTHAGWTYTKDPETDVVTWTSPISGLTCQIHPYDYLLGP
jgi:hypothetical protein